MAPKLIHEGHYIDITENHMNDIEQIAFYFQSNFEPIKNDTSKPIIF